MIALPIILVVVTLIGAKFSRFHEDYMGLSQTTAVKGFFAVVIVMSHMLGYVALTYPLDSVYRTVINHVGQLMVTLFFFYSGYGVTLSYKKKSSYYDTFLKNRVLKLLLHFDLAVALFLVMNVFLSISFPKIQYITCWVGWGSIGNSNWFIFDTLVFYLIAFGAMTVCRYTGSGLGIFASVVTVACMFFWGILAIIYGKEATWWYDTVFCFPVGIWYGVFKERIDAFAKKPYFYWPSLLLIVGAFSYLYGKRFFVEYFSVLAPVFCLLVTWVTMKVKLDNKVLAWLGKHSFSIYIIQRIPMIIIKHLGGAKNSIVFTLLAVPSTLLLAWLFSWLLSLADKLLFKKPGEKKDKKSKKLKGSDA
ncbi:MAG: acyltransferase family protein [Clostridia bacterium]|nr:acyltransferase family protein [Clostridia bacterium]